MRHFTHSCEPHRLRRGDLVRVTNTWPSHHDGWENTWTRNMDRSVGEVMKVLKVNSDRKGILLEDGYEYPYQVLELVKK